MQREASRLHSAILQHFVTEGYAPSTAQLCDMFQTGYDQVVAVLRELERQHALVLHPHTPEVWVAHPFANAPTAFAVRRRDRVWWGNCAWCSLGIAALLGSNDVTIHSTLGGEGEHIVVHVDRGRVREPLYVHFPVPMARAWDNVHFTCTTMLIFRDESDVDVWSRRHALPRGDVQPIQRVYEFASVWYGNHLDVDWRKRTIDEARSIFEQFGFAGPIWELPRSSERF